MSEIRTETDRIMKGCGKMFEPDGFICWNNGKNEYKYCEKCKAEAKGFLKALDIFEVRKKLEIRNEVSNRESLFFGIPDCEMKGVAKENLNKEREEIRRVKKEIKDGIYNDENLKEIQLCEEKLRGMLK